MITAVASAAAAAAIGAWAASGASTGSAEEVAVAEFMAAARAGSISVLTEQVEGGRVHIDAHSQDGQTALAICAEEGHGAAVRLLLSLGADWRSAVHAASRAGHVETLSPLVVASAGAAGAVSFGGAPVAASLRDAAGLLPLHEAALHARLTALEALLAVAAEPDARCADRLQRTPLMLASRCRGEAGERAAACIRVLLEHGADVAAADAAGDTALHLACAEGGEPNVAQALVEADAPLYALNGRGQAPVDLVAVGPVRALLDAAAAKRLRQGSREANAAQVAKASLVRRMRELAREEPSVLQSLCEQDGATKALLNRFGIKVPWLAFEAGLPIADEVARSAESDRGSATARVTHALRGMLRD